MTKRLIGILGIDGLKQTYKDEPFSLLLPVAFFFLVVIHPILIIVPLLLYWAIGTLWKAE